MQTTLEQAPTTFGIAPTTLGIDLLARQQRRERRYAIPRGKKLRVRTSGQNELLDAEIRDISRVGVGLLSPRVIAPGASIIIPFGNQRIFAQVRYCYGVGTGFVVGALILKVD